MSDPVMDQEEGSANDNQFVSFAVAGEMFAVQMAPVQEIIRVPEVAQLPLAPAVLDGLANLRGRVLPIINLRRLFNSDQRAHDDATRALVINLGQPLGFVVDRVSSVLSVEPSEIETASTIQSVVRAEYLTGVINRAGPDGQRQLMLVLDFQRLVDDEFAGMARGGSVASRKIATSTAIVDPMRDSSRLTVCQAGTTLDTSACECNSGYFSPSGFLCRPCPAGTWGTGGASCTPCGKGLYSDLVGQNSSGVCTPCPNNTYAPNASSGNLGAACLPCPENSATQAAGSTNRTQCKCRSDLVDGVTELGGSCYGCDANFYASADRKSCVPCPANTESRPGSLAVWQCTARGGYYAKYTKTVRSEAHTSELQSH
mgnify:CR=1 FL=1